VRPGRWYAAAVSTPLVHTLAGHWWTLAPRLRRPPPEPASSPWELAVEDPLVGPVRLTGRLSAPDDPQGVVLVVHGIAGCAEAAYAREAAAAAVRAGLACLRINLRGNDRLGEDYYHAGLTGDLAAALASPELAGFRRRYVLGYSLGGHLALKLATEPAGEGLAAVAAVCAPLDLAAGQRAFDRPANAVYRRYVMGGMRAIYGKIAERRGPGAPGLPVPPSALRRVSTIREWDERVVAPRHGFAGADDYYARMSVAPRLPELRAPALLVASAGDPMIPASIVRPVVERNRSPRLTVRWLDAGGHLGFPRGRDLASEVVAWLRSASEGRGLSEQAGESGR